MQQNKTEYKKRKKERKTDRQTDRQKERRFDFKKYVLQTKRGS
jgi:hypothetical protein